MLCKFISQLGNKHKYRSGTLTYRRARIPARIVYFPFIQHIMYVDCVQETERSSRSVHRYLIICKREGHGKLGVRDGK